MQGISPSRPQRGYDAVVVGRKGIGDVDGLILGSIANKLVNRLHHFSIWVVGANPDPNKILIAMDGSDGAIRAVDYVGDVIGKKDPNLLLLHVRRRCGSDVTAGNGHAGHHSSDDPTGRAPSLNQSQFEMEAVFEMCVGRLTQKGLDPDKIRIKTLSNVKSRADAIVKEARRQGYGTIFVGRRGHSETQEFFMGSVTCKILQLAGDMSVGIVN